MEEKKFEFDERAPYAYFQNSACPYFPCHEKANREFFNCLFCYCPLYALGGECGGDFSYTPDGVKDCSACMLPHEPGGYNYIVKSFPKLRELMERNREGEK